MRKEKKEKKKTLSLLLYYFYNLLRLHSTMDTKWHQEEGGEKKKK